jgi:uncharacterized membrane protein
MQDNMAMILAMRWLHILSVVVAVGGVFFMRMILWPAAEAVLTDEQHKALRARVVGRWKFVVHGAIFLLLVSGLYNYLVVTRPLHEGQAIYHALFGIKFLLALVVFFLAETLVSTRAWSAGIRANARAHLLVLLGIALLVILISGVMKNLPVTAAPM